MKTAITKLANNIDKIGIKSITPAAAGRFSNLVGFLLTPLEAPSGGNSHELAEIYANKAVQSTISAMLFYFISENQVNIERIKIQEMPKIDNTGVKNKYEDYN